MRNIESSAASIFGLIGHFRDEIKTLIRQEIDLGKTEMSEKIGRLGRNASGLAAGGVAAFAGLIILLASLSSLLSFAFESAGMSRSLAFFIGALIIGGSALLVGLLFVAKAARTFSKASLAPEKTLGTLKKLKSTEAGAALEVARRAAEPKRSSGEIETNIGETRKEVGETADEITERLRPRHMKAVLRRNIQAHPLRSSLIAAGTGFMSSVMIAWRIRRARV